MYAVGFDNDKYLKMQSEHILDRINAFGGKLFDDFHASRVLPGFAPDSKIKMLSKLKDRAEILIVINASDIEKNKVRGDIGITYDQDVLRLIDAFRGFGLFVGSVVLTRYAGQSGADAFKRKLENLGIPVYKHYSIEGYPSNIKLTVSDNGFGKNEYIKTQRELVVVTAPGPGSGKMATCLSQLYHEQKMGNHAGYAKFETFPVWNLSLKDPVNLAYEAATADLNDVNMIDPFHLEAYNETAVNYNRDVEVFPVVKACLERILGSCPYKSPTDMGVNMAGNCIFDKKAVATAAKNEIIRRYYEALCRKSRGEGSDTEITKIELLMESARINICDREVISAANKRAEETSGPAAALELPDGRIITGKTSNLLGASAALILNALKALAGIDKDTPLIPGNVIEPVQTLKTDYLGNHNPRLHTDEILIALCVSAVTNENANKAMNELCNLRNCEAHSSVMLSGVDNNVFKKLGINITCEPKYQTKKLFHS